MSQYSEASEKAVERYLTARTKELGGISLKFASSTQTGYPDRIVILPGGVYGWCELKSKGKNPTPLQCDRINRLRGLGHPARVCDSREKVDQYLNDLTNGF